MASWLTVGKSFKPVDRQLPTVPETVTTKRDTARTVTETVTTELVQTNYDHSSTTNGDSNVFHSHHNSHVVNSYGNSNSYRDSHRDRDSDRDSVGHSYDRKEARKEKKNKEKKKKDKKHKKKVSKNESIENAIALIDNNSNNNSNSNNSCSYSHNNDHSTIPIDDISASSDDNSVHSDTNRVLGAVNYDTHSVRYLPNKRIVTVPKESEKYRISWEVNLKGDADAFLYDFSYNPPAELVRRQYQLPSGATISSTKNRSSNNTNKTDQIYGNKLVNLAQEKLLRKENMSREQRYYSKTSKDIISNAQLKRIRVVDANNKKESQKSQENNSNSTTTSDLRNDRVVTTNGATAMVIYDYSKSMESDDHELNFIPVRNKESLASFFRSTSSTTTNSNNNDDNFGVVLDADTSLSSYQELQSRVYTEKEILEKKLYQYTKFYNEHNRVYPNKIVLWFKYIFIQNYFNNLQLIISNSNSSMNNYVKSFFEKNKKSNNYQVVIDKKIDLFQKAISIFNSISNISSTNSNSGSNDSSTIDTIVELLWLELLQFVHYYRPDAIQGFIRQSLVQLPLSTRLHYFNCSFSLRHPNSNDINNVRLKTMQTYDAIKESVANIYAAENMNKLLSNSKSNRVYRNSGEANDLTLLKSKEELEAIWCDCYYRRILAEKEAGNTELSVALVQAILEINLLARDKIGNSSGVSTFKDYWEAEFPRMGELGLTVDATDNSDKPSIDVGFSLWYSIGKPLTYADNRSSTKCDEVQYEKIIKDLFVEDEDDSVKDGVMHGPEAPAQMSSSMDVVILEGQPSVVYNDYQQLESVPVDDAIPAQDGDIDNVGGSVAVRKRKAETQQSSASKRRAAEFFMDKKSQEDTELVVSNLSENRINESRFDHLDKSSSKKKDKKNSKTSNSKKDQTDKMNHEAKKDDGMVYSIVHGYRIKILTEDDTPELYKKILSELSTKDLEGIDMNTLTSEQILSIYNSKKNNNNHTSSDKLSAKEKFVNSLKSTTNGLKQIINNKESQENLYLINTFEKGYLFYPEIVDNYSDNSDSDSSSDEDGGLSNTEKRYMTVQNVYRTHEVLSILQWQPMKSFSKGLKMQPIQVISENKLYLRNILDHSAKAIHPKLLTNQNNVDRLIIRCLSALGVQTPFSETENTLIEGLSISNHGNCYINTNIIDINLRKYLKTDFGAIRSENHNSSLFCAVNASTVNRFILMKHLNSKFHSTSSELDFLINIVSEIVTIGYNTITTVSVELRTQLCSLLLSLHALRYQLEKFVDEERNISNADSTAERLSLVRNRCRQIIEKSVENDSADTGITLVPIEHNQLGNFSLWAKYILIESEISSPTEALKLVDKVLKAIAQQQQLELHNDQIQQNNQRLELQPGILKFYNCSLRIILRIPDDNFYSQYFSAISSVNVQQALLLLIQLGFSSIVSSKRSTAGNYNGFLKPKKVQSNSTTDLLDENGITGATIEEALAKILSKTLELSDVISQQLEVIRATSKIEKSVGTIRLNVDTNNLLDYTPEVFYLVESMAWMQFLVSYHSSKASFDESIEAGDQVFVSAIAMFKNLILKDEKNVDNDHSNKQSNRNFYFRWLERCVRYKNQVFDIDDSTQTNDGHGADPKLEHAMLSIKDSAALAKILLNTKPEKMCLALIRRLHVARANYLWNASGICRSSNNLACKWIDGIDRASNALFDGLLDFPDDNTMQQSLFTVLLQAPFGATLLNNYLNAMKFRLPRASGVDGLVPSERIMRIQLEIEKANRAVHQSNNLFSEIYAGKPGLQFDNYASPACHLFAQSFDISECRSWQHSSFKKVMKAIENCLQHPQTIGISWIWELYLELLLQTGEIYAAKKTFYRALEECSGSVNIWKYVYHLWLFAMLTPFEYTKLLTEMEQKGIYIRQLEAVKNKPGK